MPSGLNKREKLLTDYLTAQKKLQEMEAELQHLRESNFHLIKELEEKETTVQNLFSYIENLSGSGS